MCEAHGKNSVDDLDSVACKTKPLKNIKPYFQQGISKQP